MPVGHGFFQVRLINDFAVLLFINIDNIINLLFYRLITRVSRGLEPLMPNTIRTLFLSSLISFYLVFNDRKATIAKSPAGLRSINPSVIAYEKFYLTRFDTSSQ